MFRTVPMSIIRSFFYCTYSNGVRHTIYLFVKFQYDIYQCFTSAGPRPGTGPWHQLYRAARYSPGIENKFKCNFIFINMLHSTHKCTNTLYDYIIINY